MYVCVWSGIHQILYFYSMLYILFIIKQYKEQIYFPFSEELFVCRETFIKVGPKLENYTTTNVPNLLLTYYMPVIGTYFYMI